MKCVIPILIVLMASCGRTPKPGTTTAQAAAPVTTVDAAAQEAEETGEAEHEGKSQLDDLFNQYKDTESYNQKTYWATLMIGHLFSPAYKDALFRYVEDDTIAVTFILRNSGVKWDTIFKTSGVFSGMEAHDDDWVEIKDYTGDHVPDLVVVQAFWDLHYGVVAELWAYRDGKFVNIKNFGNLITPEYDSTNNMLYSYISMGCADMSMNFMEARIQQDTVAVTKQMTCDCCSPEGDSCIISVKGEREFTVPVKEAYRYVPVVYAEGVKEKCESENK